MKSKLFNFFFWAVMLTVFVACGFGFLLQPAHNEFQLIACYLPLIPLVFLPLMFGVLMGAEWINENISVD